MATIRFEHPDPVMVPWQPGEIVTIQIGKVNDDGSYEAATMETFAPDLKQQHADELAASDRRLGDLHLLLRFHGLDIDRLLERRRLAEESQVQTLHIVQGKGGEKN